VVWIASAPEDLAPHPGPVHLLDAGELHLPEPLPAPLRVWLAGGPQDARALAAALAAQSAIVAACDPPEDGAASVTVEGADVNQAALAISDAATSAGIALVAITPVALTVDALRQRARARRHARTLHIDAQAPLMGAGGA
jgi:hypothetical protein